MLSGHFNEVSFFLKFKTIKDLITEFENDERIMTVLFFCVCYAFDEERLKDLEYEDP